MSGTSGDCELERTDSNSSDEFKNSETTKKTHIVTPDLVAALDRTGTSSRTASYILQAVAATFGVDVKTVNLSRSTIHRHRIKFRQQFLSNLKENLKIAPGLVVHWDGKLLPDIDGSGKVERLPIVVSGFNTEQLLGVPKMENGTGAAQTIAISETLNEWNLPESVKGMCFDTTSVNTGAANGTCVLLEKTIGRPLLHLTCRHHVFEIILRCVAEVCWPATNGPNVPIFKRFQHNWNKIDKKVFETGMQDEVIAAALQEKRNEIQIFIVAQFQVSQPRSDYREFLKLSHIFLEDTPPEGISFKSPGAMHHARWLSKAIYCLKIYMFKAQFNLTKHETIVLRDICIFIVLFYVKAWFTAPYSIKAPAHDLNLLQDLLKFKTINDSISRAASSKLSNHLWYLSEHLAVLAFFDDGVSNEVKAKMVHAIKHRESDNTNTRRVKVDLGDTNSFMKKDISDFITKESLFIFHQFKLSLGFLEKEPENWKDDESFQACLVLLKDIKVVNDIAERAVALMEEYNELLTRDEEQKQYLLQVVKYHRTQYPNCNVNANKS